MCINSPYILENNILRMFNIYLLRPGGRIHPLSMENWLPFPLEEHRITMYIFYLYILLGNYLSLTNLNGLMVSMFMYSSCRLQILQNKLRNSKSYITKIFNNQKYSMKHIEDKFVVSCIEEHLEIIR